MEEVGMLVYQFYVLYTFKMNNIYMATLCDVCICTKYIYSFSTKSTCKFYFDIHGVVFHIRSKA